MYFERRHFKAIFAISIPMILSNITVPLLGLVDTAVVGHLDHSYYLGGVAIGSTVISFIFWLAGFLRMSTTGMVAQAMGREDYQHAVQTWRYSTLLGLFIAILLVLLQQPIWLLADKLAGSDSNVAHFAHIYYQIRIWGAPAALLHYSTLGCLLGMKRARFPMILLIVMNVINISLDVTFVMGLHWGVAGAAVASLLADYAGAFLGIWFLVRLWRQHGEKLWPGFHQNMFHLDKIWALLRLNRDIFLRILSLQLCFSFITFEGAKLGTVILATNAVLMNFMMFASYALDGIAYSVEALAGDAYGRNNRHEFHRCIMHCLFLGGIASILFSGIYGVFGDHIVALLTTIPSIRESAKIYLPWLVVMPLLAVWSYIFDGVYIGVTLGRVMRNGMLISAFLIFFPVWWLTRSLENHGLWLALSCFMVARGGTLIVHYVLFGKDWFRKDKVELLVK